MCSTWNAYPYPWDGGDVLPGGATWNAIPGTARRRPGDSWGLVLLYRGTYKKAKNIRKKNLFLHLTSVKNRFSFAGWFVCGVVLPSTPTYLTKIYYLSITKK